MILRISYIIIFFFILLSLFYLNFVKEKKMVSSKIADEEIVEEEILEEEILEEEILEEETVEEENYTSSNILKEVKYSAKDINGNQLVIEAKEGEIDLSNKNVIFLTDVKALITLNSSENIQISSKFGKYNINNYDTIFSKNVIIDYQNNKITGEYLDFSLERNSLIASRNIIYRNNKNILKADVITMDIKTKDIKVQMYEDKKKVNIKSN